VIDDEMELVPCSAFNYDKKEGRISRKKKKERREDVNCVPYTTMRQESMSAYDQFHPLIYSLFMPRPRETCAFYSMPMPIAMFSSPFHSRFYLSEMLFLKLILYILLKRKRMLRRRIMRVFFNFYFTTTKS
jgi:hypothetical protein